MHRVRPFPPHLAVVLALDDARDLCDWIDDGGHVDTRFRFPGDPDLSTLLAEAIIDEAQACVNVLLARGVDVDALTRVVPWMRCMYPATLGDAEAYLPTWRLAHAMGRGHLLARHPRARWARVRAAVRVRPYALHWLEWHARVEEEARIARARRGVLDADAVV